MPTVPLLTTRYVLTAALGSAIALGACASRPPPPPSQPPPPPPPPAPPPEPEPDVAGVYTGSDQTTLTITTPRPMPARLTESTDGHVEIANLSHDSLQVALIDPHGAAPCVLVATGSQLSWTLRAGQTCTVTRPGEGGLTLSFSEGMAQFDKDQLTLNFTAHLTATRPGRRAQSIQGTMVYHLVAQRRPEQTATVPAGAALDASVGTPDASQQISDAQTRGAGARNRR